MSKGLEALENIKIDMEYVTRLDFVEPIVRGEVQQELYKIYHRETPELETIEKELKALEIIRKLHQRNLLKFCFEDLLYTKFITQEEYNLLKEVL